MGGNLTDSDSERPQTLTPDSARTKGAQPKHGQNLDAFDGARTTLWGGKHGQKFDGDPAGKFDELTQICSVVVKAPKRQANFTSFHCKFDAFKAKFDRSTKTFDDLTALALRGAEATQEFDGARTKGARGGAKI